MVSGATSEFGVISINIPSITISGHLKLLFFCPHYFLKIKLKIILETAVEIIYWYTTTYEISPKMFTVIQELTNSVLKDLLDLFQRVLLYLLFSI